jgi:hypothetical protein
VRRAPRVAVALVFLASRRRQGGLVPGHRRPGAGGTTGGAHPSPRRWAGFLAASVAMLDSCGCFGAALSVPPVGKNVALLAALVLLRRRGTPGRESLPPNFRTRGLPAVPVTLEGADRCES